MSRILTTNGSTFSLANSVMKLIFGLRLTSIHLVVHLQEAFGFFRLKAPRNVIGGFGIVEGFHKLESLLAWDCFEQANGAASFESFQEKVLAKKKALKKDENGTLTPRIGCVSLSPVVFFPKDSWLRQPNDWQPRNLRYKTYDLRDGEGLRIWEESQALAALPSSQGPERDGLTGKQAIIRYGQKAFKAALLDAYGKACAVTRERSPALDAAHIRPYALEHRYPLDNGLLLRADLHRLFDRGFVTVTPNYCFEVSKRLRFDFENEIYFSLHGKKVYVPDSAIKAPASANLKWHNENIYVGD